MRISDLFNTSKSKSGKAKLTIALLITGILSLFIILVTVYGQYTGTFTINMTKEAHNKGIILSTSQDFEKGFDTLRVDPIEDIEDTVESLLNIADAEKSNGQYHEEGQNYLAYTFYLKNIGLETINVNYQIKITSSYKKLDKATFVKVREYESFEDNYKLIKDKNFSKQQTNKDLIADEEIISFRPNEVKKFTFFMWLDGNYTDESMLGGAVKMNWVFSVSTANKA